MQLLWSGLNFSHGALSKSRPGTHEEHTFCPFRDTENNAVWSIAILRLNCLSLNWQKNSTCCFASSGFYTTKTVVKFLII